MNTVFLGFCVIGLVCSDAPDSTHVHPQVRMSPRAALPRFRLRVLRAPEPKRCHLSPAKRAAPSVQNALPSSLDDF